MDEGAGRRGIPSLLKSPVPAETETSSLQQEHIASDITQSKKECDHLIALVKPHLTRSKVVDPKTGGSKDSSDRTSSGMFLRRGQDTIISTIEKRIADYTSIPVENGEGLQVLHYAIGQKFEPHFDYTDGSSVTKIGGPRMATFIMYLMIEDAEEKGLISPGITTLVEPMSGNMGIGLAYIALTRGFRFIAVMPAEYSLDKQILLRYLGADLVLTDPTLGFQGQLDKVEQLKKEIPNVHVLDQFANAANPEAHFKWTGPEIWKDTAGKVDIFVAGSGTEGTVSGVGKYLKMKNPAVKVICVEPSESPVISGGKPSRHKIQGVGPGFVPKNLDTSVTDEIITVTAEDAMANARRLAREEGLLVGISSGANLAACLKVASRPENIGKMIVTVFPSGGERYMNSDLFAAIREECIAMTF